MKRSPLLLPAFLATACGGPPAPLPAPLAVVSADPATDAVLAMAAGDWPRASEHLRRALKRTPGSLDVHYRLAVCASHLGRQDEAAREFEWVLARAASDSDEARTARAWLAERGGPIRVAAAVAVAEDAPRGTGSLSGVVTWREPGSPPAPRHRQLVMLVGQAGTSTRDARYRVRTNRDGRFEFKDVVAGPYEITDAVTGAPTWRLEVTVEAGRETVLDLSTANSSGTALARDSRAHQPTEGH